MLLNIIQSVNPTLIKRCFVRFVDWMHTYINLLHAAEKALLQDRIWAVNFWGWLNRPDDDTISMWKKREPTKTPTDNQDVHCQMWLDIGAGIEVLRFPHSSDIKQSQTENTLIYSLIIWETKLDITRLKPLT